MDKKSILEMTDEEFFSFCNTVLQAYAENVQKQPLTTEQKRALINKQIEKNVMDFFNKGGTNGRYNRHDKRSAKKQSKKFTK